MFSHPVALTCLTSRFTLYVRVDVRACHQPDDDGYESPIQRITGEIQRTPPPLPAKPSPPSTLTNRIQTKKGKGEKPSSVSIIFLSRLLKIIAAIAIDNPVERLRLSFFLSYRASLADSGFYEAKF